MKIGYAYDPVCQQHNHSRHWENARRLESVISYLHESALNNLLHSIDSNRASLATLCAVHEAGYVNLIEKVSRSGGGALDPDTYICLATFDAASHAVGASIAATRAVLTGDVKRSFALVRPPGHHAFTDHGEGFCIFNNMAFAAAYALGRLPEMPDLALERVMIIDFDVHHGNGTESIFYDDPHVLYLSTHESPLYPGSGMITHIGKDAGTGATINIPLPERTGDAGYQQVFESIVIPAARRFKPQLILASVGYDAHWRDPLAAMGLSLSGYTAITQTIASLSDELCESRLVCVLEGGYDLEVLRLGVHNTFCILMGDSESASNLIGPSHVMEPDITPLIRKVKQLHRL